MKTHRQAWKALGASFIAVAALAACGSSSPSSSSTHSPPAATSPATSPTTTAPTSPSTSGATAAITANWETFFNIKTSVSKRVSLLQDGSSFETVIKAQADNPLASGLTAKVTDISNVTATQAAVKYDLIVGGSKVPQTGTAVDEAGVWKVSATTFCGLLSLEGLKTMPTACTSAG
jgi:hypothetical protein